MPDKLTTEQRHKNMSAIRSKDTSECCKIPQTNREFWLGKILRNRERDERDREHLKRLGWNVIQIWECELKPKRRKATLQSLLFTLSKIELALSNSKNSVKYDFDIDRRSRIVADDSEINYYMSDMENKKK